MRDTQRWIPAGILGVGCLLLLSVQRQRAMPLRGELSTIQTHFAGFVSTDTTIAPDEQRVAGMSQYLFRIFRRPDTGDAFTAYVGYYEEQTQGKTIHSPRNCLPGAGWEPIEASRRTLATPSGPLVVNRYLLANQNARVLVYYWYEGRGRTEASEYKVKWNLLRDAALRGRSEEALVRVVVPITPTLPNPDSLAQDASVQLLEQVRERLPA